MSKAQKYGSIVEFLEAMKHYLEVVADQPPIYPFSVLTQELKASWPEESVTELINECITKNAVGLFRILAPSSGTEIESILRDWAYAPDRKPGTNVPGPIFKYIFHEYQLSKAFGSEFLGLSIIRSWKPMIDFLIQHPKYHQGLNGRFLADALQNNRIPTDMKWTLLRSDLIKEIPDNAWDGMLAWSARNDDLDMFAALVTSGFGEHSSEFVKEIYLSIPKRDIHRFAKVLCNSDEKQCFDASRRLGAFLQGFVCGAK